MTVEAREQRSNRKAAKHDYVVALRAEPEIVSRRNESLRGLRAQGIGD